MRTNSFTEHRRRLLRRFVAMKMKDLMYAWVQYAEGGDAECARFVDAIGSYLYARSWETAKPRHLKEG